MGFCLNIHDQADGSVVSLALILDRQESSDLFLSGDSMISWPSDGLLQEGDPMLARTGIFVSEIAARPAGMTLRYATREQADRTATLLRLQLDQLGIVREE
jgi:hypothetical protein